MLVEKPYVDGDVITFKLTSGEEVIATFMEEDETVYVVRKPVILVNTGQETGIVPYILTADNDATIRLAKSAIVLNTYTQSDMAKEYLEKTTNIQMRI